MNTHIESYICLPQEDKSCHTGSWTGPCYTLLSISGSSVCSQLPVVILATLQSLKGHLNHSNDTVHSRYEDDYKVIPLQCLLTFLYVPYQTDLFIMVTTWGPSVVKELKDDSGGQMYVNNSEIVWFNKFFNKESKITILLFYLIKLLKV